MARPLKSGVDYFPMDVDEDDKIELLEAKHGLEGYAILIKLWKKIYKEGYFISWNEDIEMLFAKRINSSIELINSVVNECLRRNLFNKELYEKYKILTSHGIQQRYFKICKDCKRKNINIINEYILINVGNFGLTIEETTINSRVNSEETIINSVESTQRIEYKIKEEENKEEKKKLCKSEINFIEILKGIDNYPIDMKKDIDLYNRLTKKFPMLDILKVAEGYAVYKLDKPIKKKDNPRSQLNTACEKSLEWNRNYKEKQIIEKEKERPWMENFIPEGAL